MSGSSHIRSVLIGVEYQNYSFFEFNVMYCEFGNSTYRCGNYSREETIQGRKLYEEIRYLIYVYPVKSIKVSMNVRIKSLYDYIK